MNAIRLGHPALQQDRTLRFQSIDTDRLLVYSKTVGRAGGGARNSDAILVAVTLEPSTTQAGTVHLNLAAFELSDAETFVVRDLLIDARYHWRGRDSDIELDPNRIPANIFGVERLGA